MASAQPAAPNSKWTGSSRPRPWTKLVNEPHHESEVNAIRTTVARGRLLGSDTWVRRTAEQLGLQYALRPVKDN